MCESPYLYLICSCRARNRASTRHCWSSKALTVQTCPPLLLCPSLSAPSLSDLPPPPAQSCLHCSALPALPSRLPLSLILRLSLQVQPLSDILGGVEHALAAAAPRYEAEDPRRRHQGASCSDRPGWVGSAALAVWGGGSRTTCANLMIGSA